MSTPPILYHKCSGREIRKGKREIVCAVESDGVAGREQGGRVCSLEGGGMMVENRDSSYS
jgi:hypothetical protein